MRDTYDVENPWGNLTCFTCFTGVPQRVTIKVGYFEGVAMTRANAVVGAPVRKKAAEDDFRPARATRGARTRPGLSAKPEQKPAQSQVNARIDANLKASGDAALAAAGLTPTQAVRMLWSLAVRYQDEPEKLRTTLDPDSAEPSADELAERQRKAAAYHRCLSLWQDVRTTMNIAEQDPERKGLSDREYTDLLRDEHFREKGYLL
ncbi:type II toxin-antitoxin system RelB/DinJ family antitoxin [uncultured Enorma sp.]|jgi:antitoxin component of RelBE/YafQ-DinJ toxin-antitoxin module|uniref:type II toxin-antitoxin system RelB/DinJ family antitoxin n=1 Tax=uncultured Enorma sp. TaxID=1714346 RepID=UPI0025D6F75B|nr:type II toxin-antitoxin system RelB/DinJ family antitoxin [uncultured Enorma sp.]